ncbi:DUF4124 domain-containing protein [Marinobacter sp.]|uniref:DUF4124 domain-containing protein n=1 Tax=Marinobacter sp. TaxID=50741 RepID=UPI0034A4DEF4
MKGLLVFLCLLTPSVTWAGVYKWVDANGQSHFGDRPPPSVRHRSRQSCVGNCRHG